MNTSLPSGVTVALSLLFFIFLILEGKGKNGANFLFEKRSPGKHPKFLALTLFSLFASRVLLCVAVLWHSAGTLPVTPGFLWL